MQKIQYSSHFLCSFTNYCDPIVSRVIGYVLQKRKLQSLRRFPMQEIVEATKVVSSMPPWALVAAVVFAGFALAAYAIYAVTSVAKGRG